MTPKERQADLIKRLRDAAKMQDLTAKAAIELVQLLIEETKESLVSADKEDMYRLQGAARCLQKLHRDLTTTPPAIWQSGE